MEKRLARGVPPEKIAFVSFTRAAVREARDRACANFGFDPDQLPYFRTLHSLCFRQLGLRRGDVFGHESLTYLAELTGEELTGKHELDAPTLGERGDALLFLDQYARGAQVTLEDAWHTHGAPIDKWRLDRFVRAYTSLRSELGLVDFTDMLERYVDTGDSVDVELALLDEAQDLTPLQWRVVDRAFGSVPELIVAGDDDQGIYHWAGASADALLGFDGEKEVLSQSYRLPRSVWVVAQQVASGIVRRNEKAFAPTENYGVVEWIARPDEVDLSTGTWLLLARTRRQLATLAALARGQGVAYTLTGRSSVDSGHIDQIREYERFRGGDPTIPLWHDALTDIPPDDREYLLACLRRGESLTRTPRIRIETIHGAKGAEADNVMLLTDINARVKRGMDLDSDAEQRVLYVAVTRAREALYLVEPQNAGASYQL